MIDNRIQQYRAAIGLTSAELADLAGAGQEQILRVETGVQAPRFAVRICLALSRSLEEVFPLTRGPVAEALRAGEDVYEDGPLAVGLTQAGLDMSAAQWTFRCRLRGGWSFELPVTGPEKDRLWSESQTQDDGDFLVFDSEDRRYAINPKHLMFWQFVFDPARELPKEAEAAIDERLNFYLIDGESIGFHVSPDEEEISNDPEDERDVQLQDLFSQASERAYANQLSFSEDGERAFFRASDVAAFSARLLCVEPKLWEAYVDERDD